MVSCDHVTALCRVLVAGGILCDVLLKAQVLHV